MGQLMEELETLQEQFAPHRANYTRMLMAANNAEVLMFLFYISAFVFHVLVSIFFLKNKTLTQTE